jgi:hypothetical protein
MALMRPGRIVLVILYYYKPRYNFRGVKGMLNLLPDHSCLRGGSRVETGHHSSKTITPGDNISNTVNIDGIYSVQTQVPATGATWRSISGQVFVVSGMPFSFPLSGETHPPD